MDDVTACPSAAVLRSSHHATYSASVIAVLNAAAAEAEAVAVSSAAATTAAAETGLAVFCLCRHVHPHDVSLYFSSSGRTAVPLSPPTLATAQKGYRKKNFPCKV